MLKVRLKLGITHETMGASESSFQELVRTRKVITVSEGHPLYVNEYEGISDLKNWHPVKSDFGVVRKPIVVLRSK